jgi:protease PrsW
VSSTDETRSAAVAASGWGYPVRFFQPGNPAFWVYVYLVGTGAFLYYGLVKDVSDYATGTVLALALCALYTLPFVWFITRRDRYEREPAKLAILGFLWGGLAAAWVMAAPANSAILSIYSKVFSVDFAATWGPAFTAPFTEETSKYVGLILLFLLARNHVRSAYDGLLLGAFTGLGFQIFENFSYMTNAVINNFGASQAQDVLQVFAARGVTGITGHWLFTAIAGTGLGYFIGAKNRSFGHRFAVAAGFLLLAMLSHGLFDAASGSPILLFVGIVVGIVGIVIAWRFADRRQRTWMGSLLGDEVANGTVTKDELAVLEGPRKARKSYLESRRKDKGKQAARNAGLVLDAQIDLAARIAATDDPSGPEVSAARAEVARLRALPA